MSGLQPSAPEQEAMIVDAPPLTAMVFRFVAPRVYLASVVAGFLLCVAAGWLAGRLHRFDGFVRFHPYINAETLYNATALQVQRLVETIPRDRIAVIIGGSSKLHGTGMTPDELWSHELQRRLGDRYGVLNLALRSGRTDHFGMHAAEMLARSGRPAILIGDVDPAMGFNGVGSYQPYQYFFYDARARGLLYDWPAREAALMRSTAAAGAAQRARLDELELHGTANASFNFDDLWNFVGYRYVFLGAWHPLTGRGSWRPRRTYDDLETRSAPPEGYYGLHQFAAQMRIARGWAIRPPPHGWEALIESTQTIPEPIRARMVLVMIGRSPYYVDQLSVEEQDLYNRHLDAYIETLRNAGLTALRAGRSWDARDFVDVVHMSPRGGARLAAELAPVVEQMARRLGYME